MNQNNNLQKNMSVFILFYAFGIVNDKEIVDLCCMNDKNIKDKV